MSLGLKTFWLFLLVVIIGGLGYLAFFGVPSPHVDVRHKIDLTNRFK